MPKSIPLNIPVLSAKLCRSMQFGANITRFMAQKTALTGLKCRLYKSRIQVQNQAFVFKRCFSTEKPCELPLCFRIRVVQISIRNNEPFSISGGL